MKKYIKQVFVALGLFVFLFCQTDTAFAQILDDPGSSGSVTCGQDDYYPPDVTIHKSNDRQIKDLLDFALSTLSYKLKVAKSWDHDSTKIVVTEWIRMLDYIYRFYSDPANKDKPLTIKLNCITRNKSVKPLDDPIRFGDPGLVFGGRYFADYDFSVLTTEVYEGSPPMSPETFDRIFGENPLGTPVDPDIDIAVRQAWDDMLAPRGSPWYLRVDELGGSYYRARFGNSNLGIGFDLYGAFNEMNGGIEDIGGAFTFDPSALPGISIRF